MGTTSASAADDLYYDQSWVVCQSCGCLQLSKLIPLEILYSVEHSAGAVGQIWHNHHQQFAEFILEDSPSDICEIGAAHGELSRIILNRKPNTEYSIIEPSPIDIPEQVKVIVGYAEDHLKEISDHSNIVHSHVLEHLYNPTNFLSKIAESMAVNSIMYISFPNIERLIATRGTNSLNFEHSYFLHQDQIASVLKSLGLNILRQKKYIEHSYFLKVGKIKNLPLNEKVEILNISHSIKPFREMWNELNSFVESTNHGLRSKKVPTYVFGAHVFSQSLISLGLEIGLIEGILDNAEAKQGQRLYGTNLTVSNPSIIQGKNAVRVILKASHYQEEIRNQLLGLNPLVEIIE